VTVRRRSGRLWRRPAKKQHDHRQRHDAVDRQQGRAHRVDAMLMGGPGGDEQ
jgi:hypothetical protein